MRRDILRKLAMIGLVTFAMQAVAQETVAPLASSATEPSPVKSQPDVAAKTNEPELGPDGMPKPKVELDKHGKPKKTKEKPPKLVPVSIVNGILTIDGITGKASLNYDIPDIHFLYVWAPGIGTVVISNKPFPWAKEQAHAFTQNTIDVMVQDHKLEIYSDKPLFDKKQSKEVVRDIDKQLVSAWVRVDTDFQVASNYPSMGYGTTPNAPYAWPGSKPVEKRTRGVVAPPPMPTGLRPVLLGANATAAPTSAPAQLATH